MKNLINIKNRSFALRYMYHEHCMNFQSNLMQECSAKILKNIFTCIYVNYLHHFVFSKIMENYLVSLHSYSKRFKIFKPYRPTLFNL